jgi:hypothetical protein
MPATGTASNTAPRNKSLFAFFSSEKEDLLSLKKGTKKRSSSPEDVRRLPKVS